MAELTLAELFPAELTLAELIPAVLSPAVLIPEPDPAARPAFPQSRSFA